MESFGPSVLPRIQLPLPATVATDVAAGSGMADARGVEAAASSTEGFLTWDFPDPDAASGVTAEPDARFFRESCRHPIEISLATPPAQSLVALHMAGEPIEEFNPFPTHAKEVDAMDQAMRGGEGTAIYEPAQNAVDYGRENDPPPRIYLIYEDGRQLEFTGTKVDRRGLVGIDFFNAGNGLSPEHLGMKHHGGGDGTLGEHGQGLKIAISYLLKSGMGVEIRSNFKGQAWQGGMELKRLTDTQLDKPVLRGVWSGTEARETHFIVKNPNPVFLDCLDTFPNYFLYANPKYADAVLVRYDPHAPSACLDESLGSGRVICLNDTVPWADPPRNRIYVDGLCVQPRGGRFLFPWALSGFRDYSQYSSLYVRRSGDSRMAEGHPESVVALALRRMTDETLWDQLITAALDPQHQHQLPLELSDPSTYGVPKEVLEWKAEALAALKSAWDKRFPDTMVTFEKWVKEKSGNARVVLVRGTLFGWLVKVGVKDAALEVSVKKTEIQMPSGIRIDYVQEPLATRLEKLFAEAGHARGHTVVREVDGVKTVQVYFEQPFMTETDVEDRDKPGIQWTRAAAVIAHVSELNIDIVSETCGESPSRALISFSVQPYWEDPQRFTANPVLEISPLPTNSQSRKSFLVVTLSGEPLQQLTPTPDLATHLASLAGQHEQRVMEEQARASAAKPQVPAGLEDTRSRLEREGLELAERADRLDEDAAEYRRQLEADLEGDRQRLEEKEREARRREQLLWQKEQELQRLQQERDDELRRDKEALERKKQQQAYAGQMILASTAAAALFFGAAYGLDRTGVADPVFEMLTPYAQTAVEKTTDVLTGVVEALSPEADTQSKIPSPSYQVIDVDGNEGVYRLFDSSAKMSTMLGVHTPDYRVRDVPVEKLKTGSRPFTAHGDFPLAGYYRDVTLSHMRVNPLTLRAEWAAFRDFEPVTFPSTPPEGTTISHVLHRPLHGEDNLPIREGTEIVAIASMDNTPIEVLRSPHTGDVIARGNVQEITIYLAPASSPRSTQPPAPLELEQLVRLDDLTPRWQALIKAVRERSDLTPRQKAAIILREWGQNFEYRAEDILDAQVIGPDRETISAQIINTDMGICNTAAGGIPLLRAIGIGSRMVTGVMLRENGTYGLHAYIEFWDGEHWLAYEPQQDTFWENPEFLPTLIDIENPAFLADESGLYTQVSVLQSEVRPTVEEIEKNLRRPSVIVPALGRNQPPSPATTPWERFKTNLTTGVLMFGSGALFMAWRKNRQQRRRQDLS